MKDDAVIKDNEAVYLLNEQTYLHLRENLQGVGYEVFDKNSPLPVEEGQIPREALGNTQRRIETARAYYLAEHQDEPVGRIQNVAVTTLEKFRSGVRRRRNLAPRSLPENDVRFIDPMYNELFRIPDGGVVQITYPDGHQRSEKVEYLDDYHMKIGSTVQHICEFAERMARSRGIVEPEPLTQQDCRAWNLEYDYYLTVQADNGAWNYALYQGDCCLLERGKIDAPELMIEEVRDEILYSHNLRNKDCIPLCQEEFAQKLTDRNEIQSYRINEEQAATIRMVFTLYSQGYGEKAIVNELSRLGRKDGHGNVSWSCTKISRILRNATYMGYICYNKSKVNNYLEKKRINNLDETSFVYVKGNFEPIVSESLWHECERIRKSRISSLRLPDGETRRKGARTTKNLWVSKLRCRCGSSYRIFNWRKLKDGTPVFGYQCNMRTVNPTRSFVLEHNMTQQLSCDAISIPEWKLELMAKKIFEKVWGNQNKAILRACKMIESCQNGKAHPHLHHRL